jgi:hypothetical protein
MKRIRFFSAISGILLAIPASVLADVQIGAVTIKDDGRIVFSDSSEQSTATLQGPQGSQGPKGDPGTPGSQVTKDAMCQVYADANLPTPPFCDKKIIFLTSQKFDGNLGGLEGADQKCQDSAATAELAGTYKAWLSDLTIAAKDRLQHSTVSYVRTDGVVVAVNWIDLADGYIKDLIICDEFKDCSYFGTYPSQYDGNVFTGTTAYGNKYNATTDYYCSGWTSSSTSAEVGVNTSIQYWTTFEVGSCSVPRRLYCIQQ